MTTWIWLAVLFLSAWNLGVDSALTVRLGERRGVLTWSINIALAVLGVLGAAGVVR